MINVLIKICEIKMRIQNHVFIKKYKNKIKKKQQQKKSYMV